MKLTRSLARILIVTLVLLAAVPAAGQQQPPKSGVEAIDRIWKRQAEQATPWKEAQVAKQVEFLSWVGTGVALIGILAWAIRPRSATMPGRGTWIAAVIIFLDLILVVVSGLSVLSPTPTMGTLFLVFICYAAAIPHLIALAYVLAAIGSVNGFSRAQIFIAGVGLVTPLLFFLSLAIGQGWSVQDLWTPGPERLSRHEQNGHGVAI